MSSFINRLFNRSEDQNSPDLPSTDQKSTAFLKYFYSKGFKSQKLDDLVQKLSHLQLDLEEPFALYYLIQHYLDIEHYLTKFDAGFLGDVTILRDEITSKFPEIDKTDPFQILKFKDTTQEISLGLLLADFIYERAIDHCGYISVLPPKFQIAKDIELTNIKDNIVYYLASKRRLKEYIEKIAIDITDKCKNKDIPSPLENWYLEFTNFYNHLESSNKLPDYFFEPLYIKEISEQQQDARLESSKVDSVNTSIQSKVSSDESSLCNAALENLIDKVIIFDRSGVLLSANEEARRLFSLDHMNRSDRNIFNLLPQDIADDLKMDLTSNSEGRVKNVLGKKTETHLQIDENILGYYEIATSNNYTEDVDSYTMLFKDITQKRDTLDTLSKEMEHVQRAAKAKSTFLSNMSHEIRTPLNVILGLADIVKKSENKDQDLFKKNIDGIDFSAKSLLSIVNDILDFSKIEAEKLSIQSYDYNLRTVITSLTNGFVTKANEKGVKLYTEINEGIPDIVIGDQYRLNQILTNLIGNAIKFTEEGEIKVVVDFEERPDEMIEVQFEISDSGIGMSEDQLEHIFDSFYQIEAAGQSKSKGTGLGLAIAKELISLQNGELSVESKEGEGSCFNFYLPLKRSKLQSTEETHKDNDRNDEKLIGLRILVADDNNMNQFYLKQLLNNLQIDVDIAENGQEAVDIFHSHDRGYYDLILMDLHMPVLGGIGAIEKIRQSNKDVLKKVPIVMCSADVFPESRKKAIRAGIDFYLTKPVDEKALKEVLFWLKSGEEIEIAIEAETDPSSDNRNSSVDIKKLKETFDNDDEFIISLLDVFIAETPEDYKSLSTCIERGFYERASELAHKMKSSYMNLGMTNQGYLLQQIEKNVSNTEGVETGIRYFEDFKKTYTKTLLHVNIQLIELKRL